MHTNSSNDTPSYTLVNLYVVWKIQALGSSRMIGTSPKPIDLLKLL